MARISDPNITNDMVQGMAAPMELDLEAVFNVMETEILKLLESSGENGTSPEEFILIIENMFTPGEELIRVEKEGIMGIPDIGLERKKSLINIANQLNKSLKYYG